MLQLPRVLIHQQAVARLPPSGQRRDIILKLLRKIQVNEQADLLWHQNQLSLAVKVNVCVGYAITWRKRKGIIEVLDIRGQ
jgi:hypothetical protein